MYSLPSREPERGLARGAINLPVERAGRLSVGPGSVQMLMKCIVAFGALVASFLLEFLAGL